MNTEKTTTKLTGENKTAMQVGREIQDAATARAVIAALSQDNRVRRGRRAMIAEIIGSPQPYSVELLTATPFTGTVPAAEIPVRVKVSCPLCRRRNTVRLLSQECNRLAKLACSYDGCRGYEWEQNI